MGFVFSDTLVLAAFPVRGSFFRRADFFVLPALRAILVKGFRQKTGQAIHAFDTGLLIAGKTPSIKTGQQARLIGPARKTPETPETRENRESRKTENGKRKTERRFAGSQEGKRVSRFPSFSRPKKTAPTQKDGRHAKDDGFHRAAVSSLASLSLWLPLQAFFPAFP
ncbi:hypothetical protein [Oxalobacter paraformigenes]|uniref:Uncharacterized protein n=1 Tax=Oxalobacter paraformigenes TaxID=556268 RepID=T5LTA4_9BURK|nr:hypothetical protein [Oxalobacter paraformigenes]EQM95279.1 hypothetical protein OFAG_02173 [Oxalobacter paraformigenes]